MSYSLRIEATEVVMAPIRIDASTGALVTSRFVIDRDMRRRDLKRIDADVFEILHEYQNFLSCFVARVPFDDWRIDISADLIDFTICRLHLSASQEGDGRANLTAAKDEQAKHLFLRILDDSELYQGFSADWGRVAIEFENRNCYHYLGVIYRELTIRHDRAR